MQKRKDLVMTDYLLMILITKQKIVSSTITPENERSALKKQLNRLMIL